MEKKTSPEINTSTTYFLDSDNRGHWYIIDKKISKAWNKCQSYDDDDPRGWKIPEGAVMLNHPQEIEFFISKKTYNKYFNTQGNKQNNIGDE